MAASKLLVWGGVELAREFGVSDLVIGLTVVALGTSLPELASSVTAVKKGQHDLALGNVLGSNLFNTLAVTGVAGLIQPIHAEPQSWYRDAPVMLGFTLILFVFGWGFRNRPGRINRWEAGMLIGAYAIYMIWIVL